MNERMTKPLNEEETAHLHVIYKTRLKNFAFIYAFLVLLGIYEALQGGPGGKYSSARSYKAYDYEIAGHVMTPWGNAHSDRFAI